MPLHIHKKKCTRSSHKWISRVTACLGDSITFILLKLNKYRLHFTTIPQNFKIYLEIIFAETMLYFLMRNKAPKIYKAKFKICIFGTNNISVVSTMKVYLDNFSGTVISSKIELVADVCLNLNRKNKSAMEWMLSIKRSLNSLRDSANPTNFGCHTSTHSWSVDVSHVRCRCFKVTVGLGRDTVSKRMYPSGEIWILKFVLGPG